MVCMGTVVKHVLKCTAHLKRINKGHFWLSLHYVIELSLPFHNRSFLNILYIYIYAKETRNHLDAWFILHATSCPSIYYLTHTSMDLNRHGMWAITGAHRDRECHLPNCLLYCTFHALLCTDFIWQWWHTASSFHLCGMLYFFFVQHRFNRSSNYFYHEKQ